MQGSWSYIPRTGIWQVRFALYISKDEKIVIEPGTYPTYVARACRISESTTTPFTSSKFGVHCWQTGSQRRNDTALEAKDPHTAITYHP